MNENVKTEKFYCCYLLIVVDYRVVYVTDTCIWLSEHLCVYCCSAGVLW